MKQATITINRQDILNETAKLTAYIGASRQAAGEDEAYDRIATTDANAEILTTYFDEALNAVRLLLAEWTDPTQDTNGTQDGEADGTTKPGTTNTATIRLLLPDNIHEEAAGIIQKAAFQYILYSSVARWLLITHKDDAQEMATLADTRLTILREALHKRRRPQRP